MYNKRNPLPNQMLSWVFQLLTFSCEHENRIKGLTLFNDVERIAGKTYYYICIQIDAIPAFDSHIELPSIDGRKPRQRTVEEEMEDEVFETYCWLTSPCSFYSSHHDEREVEAHYYWVAALLEAYKKKYKLNPDIRPFQEESFLWREKERYWEVQNMLRTHKFLGEPGDLALVRERSGKERLIELDRLNISSKCPYSGCEVRTNLETGKVRVDYIAEENLIAVLSKEEFNKVKQEKALRHRDQLIEQLKRSSRRT